MQPFFDVDKESLTTALNQLQAGIGAQGQVITTLNGTGNQTISALQMVGGVILRTGIGSGTVTDTTATAAAILAQLPRPTIGDTFTFSIMNFDSSATNYSLAAGAGVTLSYAFGAPGAAIPVGMVREFIGTVTGVATPAITLQAIETENWSDLFGGGSAPLAAEGNCFRFVSGTGVSPGATGQDSVLSVYSIPANSFDIAGRGLNFVAMGSFANNVNSKRVKIIFNPSAAVVGSAVTGGTTIADTGAYTTTGAVGWQVEANVFKYGASGSNTQIGLHLTAQMGSAVGSLVVPTALTATESGAILVAVTGNAATTASDIVCNFYEVNGMN